MPSKPNGGREVPNLCCDGEAVEILRGHCFEDLVTNAKVVHTRADHNKYNQCIYFSPHAFVTVQLPSHRQHCK